MSSPWFKLGVIQIILFVALTSYLKRAVAKDRGEDGSGQHGDDGQDHRHAVCVGRDQGTLLLWRHHLRMTDMIGKFTELVKK